MVTKTKQKINRENKRKRLTKAQRKLEKLDHINANTAGIDIGSKSHYVAVLYECDDEPVREFLTFTNDLIALSNWLKKCKITTVAMESMVFFKHLLKIFEDISQRC